ncbi:unnamed protein product [Heligmosomoides polygyrus]|uniref:Aldehyde dehydrogenase n=1 Tax=Heligmosomoides polygyrus TaxID=6339 RepID=A0A183GDJ8_HELPZ|nr:unnamed protein product [Heligmosomoides polygyrus]
MRPSTRFKVQKTFATALDQPVIMKEPLGVVLIISPWNYPVSMTLLPLIPAIAAGNTVILKPSEMSPHTSAAFEKLIPRYFDPEFLTVINGGVPETTELLKERFDHILYTGCPPVGKIVMTAAAKHLTPVTLELGGKCPVVVEDDADLEITARRLAWGKWLNCGQTCLAPDYVLVSAASKPKLVDGIRRSLGEFYGNDIQSSKDYSRIINQRHHEPIAAVADYEQMTIPPKTIDYERKSILSIDTAHARSDVYTYRRMDAYKRIRIFSRISALLDSSKGTVLFKGGERDRDDLFIPPVILDVKADDPFMSDEIFGPVLPILTVSNLSEAIEYINSGEKPLAAYIFTRNDARYPPISDAKVRQLARLTGTRRALPSMFSWLSGIPVIVVSVVVGMFLQASSTPLTCTFSLLSSNALSRLIPMCPASVLP